MKGNTTEIRNFLHKTEFYKNYKKLNIKLILNNYHLLVKLMDIIRQQMDGSLRQRGQIELPAGCPEHLAHSHLTGTVYERTDDHKDVIHHRREEHHKGHDDKDDARGAHAGVTHPLSCHAFQFIACIHVAALL